MDKILRQQQNDRKLVEETRSQVLKPISVPDPRMSWNLTPEPRSLSPPRQAGVPGGWDPSPPKAVASNSVPVPAPALPSLPAPSTPEAHPQHTVHGEDVGRQPIIANLNNALQNIKRKIPGFNGLPEDALTPSNGRSPPR